MFKPIKAADANKSGSDFIWLFGLAVWRDAHILQTTQNCTITKAKHNSDVLSVDRFDKGGKGG